MLSDRIYLAVATSSLLLLWNAGAAHAQSSPLGTAVPSAPSPSDAPPTSVTPTSESVAPASPDVARDLFRRGSALAAENRWIEALNAYRESYERYPHAETRYNIGVCHGHLGSPTRAAYEIGRALQATDLHASRHLSEERRQRAVGQLELTTQRLTRLVLSTPPTGLRLSVDGRELAQGAPSLDLRVLAESGDVIDSNWASHHVLLLDPGEHVIQLLLRDVRQERRITTRPGELIELRWEPEPAPKPAAPLASRSEKTSRGRMTPLPTGAPTTTGESWSRWAPTVAWSVVGISALTAGVGGVWTWSTHRELQSRCPNGACTERERPLVNDYQTAVTLTNAGLWATASSLALTVGLLTLTDRTDVASLTLGVSPGGLALGQTF